MIDDTKILNVQPFHVSEFLVKYIQILNMFQHKQKHKHNSYLIDASFNSL